MMNGAFIIFMVSFQIGKRKNKTNTDEPIEIKIERRIYTDGSL